LPFRESAARFKEDGTYVAARRQSFGGFMAIALRKHSTLVNDNAPPSRDQVLARYRTLREISKRHHHEVLKLISGDALLRQARRLGLAQGKTLILDDIDEMNYIYDLAIHTASPERSRAIDRYAKSARLAEGSDEALVLEAMRNGQFSILLIERRHETAGLIATDLFRGCETWLVDIGLESSMTEGSIMATRLFTPERFSMTAGVNVPLDLGMFKDVLAGLPRRLGEIPPATVIDNRHFAEKMYGIALANGITDRVKYMDLPDEG
jgi:hypothetical protein